MRTQTIKSTVLFSCCLTLALVNKGQQLRDMRYASTETSLYLNPNTNAKWNSGEPGFGKKVLGSLLFVTGGATCVVGVGVAWHGLKEYWKNDDDIYLSDNEDWQAAGGILMLGLCGMYAGSQIVKYGGVNAHARKVMFKAD